jgi:hypothetical protein
MILNISLLIKKNILRTRYKIIKDAVIENNF